MTIGWWHHLRRRDVHFVAMVAVNLLLIGAFLAAAGPAREGPAGGWRKIDTAAVLSRIDEGELQKTEARWYRPGPAGEEGR